MNLNFIHNLFRIYSQNIQLKMKLKETNNKRLYEALHIIFHGTGFDKNDTLKKILLNDMVDFWRKFIR